MGLGYQERGRGKKALDTRPRWTETVAWNWRQLEMEKIIFAAVLAVAAGLAFGLAWKVTIIRRSERFEEEEDRGRDE